MKRTRFSVVAGCLLTLVAQISCSATGSGAPGGNRNDPKSSTKNASDADGGLGNVGNTSGTATTTTTTQSDGGAATTDAGKVATIEPISIDQCGATNPAGISVADAQKLIAGSGSAGALHMLYPYDGTVFPRGMISPEVMWDGGGDYVYLHIKSKAFEYKGCLKPSAAGRVTVPQDVWDQAAARTYGPSDPYSVQLSILTAGAATGPVSLHINIAQATMKGSIYYNSYSSKLTGVAVGGNVLRIPAGKPAEVFISSTCNGCHSVSADGSRLISQVSIGGGGVSFELVPGGGPNPPSVADGPRASFGALYPDGSKYLSTSGTLNVARSNLTALGAPAAATLYETKSATVLTATGIPEGALMPMFSPNGGLLTFNDYAIGNGQGLAIVKFDNKTNTASDYRQLYQETAANIKPAWPFFLPDDKGIVFQRSGSLDFSGDAAGISGAGAANAPFGELSLLDVTSGKVSVLAQAMGYRSAQDAAAGTSYLPFGKEELQHVYFPTVSPVAAGGYFWVFFDAIRHYGNLGMQRQLWGAAIDIDANGDYTVDRSHPAFYLPGQEFGTGNHRAFAALDPCKKDGDTCTTGIDCCGGFCTVPDAKPGEFAVDVKGTCKVPMVPTCAKRDERCKTTADCCTPTGDDPPTTCIAGYCAVTPPPA